MSTSPAAPIPAGTLCRLNGAEVRAYAKIWPGRLDYRYECWPAGVSRSQARPSYATRDQLQPIGGL